MWYIIFIPIWLANTLYSAFPNMNHHPVSPPPRDIYHIFSWCSLTQSHIINFRRVLFSYYWSHCLYAYTRKLTKFNTRSIQIKWDCFIVESLNHKRLFSQVHIYSWEAPHQCSDAEASSTAVLLITRLSLNPSFGWLYPPRPHQHPLTCHLAQHPVPCNPKYQKWMPMESVNAEGPDMV